MSRITEAMVEAGLAAWDSAIVQPATAAGDCMRAALEAALSKGAAACSGGFVITNGSGEKYMAWGQVGPEWVADRSAALWLVRRADAEALATENEDAWSILPVERCSLPPKGWACALADGHEGPCPTVAALAATGKQALTVGERETKCATCDGWGRIGGPSFNAPDEGGEPCPDCAAPPAQGVDLGQFRVALKYAARSADYHASTAVGDKLRELLALIDQRDGKGER